jgi:hypothetical protein
VVTTDPDGRVVVATDPFGVPWLDGATAVVGPPIGDVGAVGVGGVVVVVVVVTVERQMAA